MKTTRLLVAAIVCASLTFGTAAMAKEHMSEKVDMKTLPEEVQKTIKEKSAGGEVVQVTREDDKDGKWNYEVIVKTEGKEWGFEVSPSGKYLKKHDDHTKRE